MALLQRTLASGSIWIGIGESSSAWGGYWTGNYPFAMYSGGSPMIWVATQADSTYSFKFSTQSRQQSEYFSDAYPMGYGYRIWSEDLRFPDNSTTSLWKAMFDDITVRGQLNVWQFVINQIRATNGALWISDAAKAINITYSVTTDTHSLILTFDSGSTMPFMQGDIIRAKRWITSGSASVSTDWDVILRVDTASWGGHTLTGSVGFTNSGLTYQSFCVTGSQYGTQWVRMGSDTDSNRKGSIYLTSNAQFGPYLDVYNDVDTFAKAYGGPAGMPGGTHKLRLGRLNGLDSTTFSIPHNTYGLYADGAYLRGQIVANEGGTLSNWTIGANDLSSKNVHLHSETNNTYLGFNATDWNQEKSIYIGSGSQGVRFGLSGSANNYLWFSNSILTIKTPNFAVDGVGNVSMTGTVSATSGQIGGWTIESTQLSSGNVYLNGTDTYIYIGEDDTPAYEAEGIYIGQSENKYQLSLFNNVDNYLKWSGTELSIKTPHFQLTPSGNIIASEVNLSGAINAQSGWIDTWKITNSAIWGNSLTGGQVRIATSGSYLDLIDSQYDFNTVDTRFASLRYNSISVYSQTDETFTTSTGFQTTSIVYANCSYSAYSGAAGVAVTQSYGTVWKAVVFLAYTNSVITGTGEISPTPIWDDGGAF